MDLKDLLRIREGFGEDLGRASDPTPPAHSSLLSPEVGFFIYIYIYQWCHLPPSKESREREVIK